MEKFLWGVASAAAQVEGGYNKDGRSLSIWDTGSIKGHIKDGHTTFDTCNTYDNVEEDIKILKELGVNSYRFSISWSRLIPDGTGEVNLLGVKYYNELIDALLENGIEPFITLYHWDLPQCLMDRGGFLSRDIADWFEYYATTCAKLFGDRVKYFMTFNEPECICHLGYGTGSHAPYIQGGVEYAAIAAHHLLLANGKAVRALKKYCTTDVKVGFVIACSPKIPLDEKTDVEFAREAMFAGCGDNLFNNIHFTDPIVLGKYPEHIVSKFSKPLIYDEKDMDIIKCDLDFIGVNIYQGDLISADGKGGYKMLYHPLNTPKSLNKCNFVPKCAYYSCKFMSERYNNLPIYITENGVSLTDVIGLDGKVNDDARVLFIDQHVKEVVRAKNDGINLLGYFHWTIYDNLEWGAGASMRFGIVYTDFITFEKIPKKSYYHYKELIKQYKNI